MQPLAAAYHQQASISALSWWLRWLGVRSRTCAPCPVPLPSLAERVARTITESFGDEAAHHDLNGLQSEVEPQLSGNIVMGMRMMPRYQSRPAPSVIVKVDPLGPRGRGPEARNFAADFPNEKENAEQNDEGEPNRNAERQSQQERLPKPRGPCTWRDSEMSQSI
jgi:hypothetical protein